MRSVDIGMSLAERTLLSVTGCVMCVLDSQHEEILQKNIRSLMKYYGLLSEQILADMETKTHK